MRKLRTGIVAAILAALPSLAAAQSPSLSDNLAISANKAWTWSENGINVAQFDGPVSIELDNVRMHADSAVIWVKTIPGAVLETQQIEIALVGHVSLQHGTAKRSGDRLFVTAVVRNSIRINAQDRLARDRSEAATYRVAAGMRDESGLTVGAETGRWRLPRPSPVVQRPEPTSRTTPAQIVKKQVRLKLPGKVQTQHMPDDTLALVIEGGMQITIHQDPDQLIELFADRGVIFTNIKQLAGSATLQDMKSIEDAVDSVYLEGDVRINFTPKSAGRPDSILEANQAFYEIATDRAVLTQAVVHTMDPGSRVPIILRAQTLKQLSREEDRAEYRLDKSVLTTSSFATPSYAINADKAYVKQVHSGDDWYGTRTEFSGKNSTLTLWGAPIGWLPYTGGSVTDRGFPLRAFDIGSSSRFGFYTRSEWGLFETMGRQPPRDLDITYRADYLANRGPGGGINANYRGGFVTETTRQPWSFDGTFQSYLIYDTGVDKFGGDRQDIQPTTDIRGWIGWEHQQFMPDNWQVQLKGNWISDPTFMEEYYPNTYHGIEPSDTSVYIKHQKDTEALTLLVQGQPNKIVSSSEFAQENREVEHLPEVGYYRVGDSFGENNLTFFSANTVSRLHYQPNTASFLDLGYGPYSPGLPSTGTTGVTSQYVDRGDFRQEVGYPITLDKFRVLPYIMGRYTGYDDTPTGGSENRTFGGAGVRMTTAFWKVDDDIASDLWDIHRMRHVVEPEINFFSSASSAQRQDVFVYDEPIDAINDVTVAQLALHQRWQTKRGGPGKWQNVDFFTWNVEGNFFMSKPDDQFLEPKSFRGLFFPSAPETSVPRNSLNSDALWRLSDSTALLADEEYNLDETNLATASLGLAVRRGDRTTFYVGDRYISANAVPPGIDPLTEPGLPQGLEANILSLLMNYEISTKYSLGLGQSYDFSDANNVSSSVSLTRRFDRFYVAVSLNVDDTTGQSGFFVSVRPNYLPSNATSSNLPSVFGNK